MLGRAFRVAWRPAASCGFLSLLAWLVPIEEIVNAFAGVDRALAFLALALVLPMAATKATIFWLAAKVQGLSFTIRQMLAIQLSSAFYTILVPGQLGGTVSRWYKMQRPGRQPIEAAAVMLMARFLETGVACLIGLILALADPTARMLVAPPLLFATLTLLIFLAPALAFSASGRRLARRIVALLPNQGRLAALRSLMPRLGEAAKRMHVVDPAIVIRMIALSVLWNGLGILSIALAAASAGAEISWVVLGWVRAMLAVILLLPLAWGGVGMREASVAALLQPYGVAPATAVAIGAIVSLRNILEAIIGALVELATLWSKPSSRKAPAETHRIVREPNST